MATGAAESRQTPPYLPFKTFKGFLENLKEAGIPGRVDTSVMRGMSGSAQSQLRGGLRFLDLIDDSGGVTKALRELTSTVGSDNWPDSLRQMILSAYAPAIADLNLETATLHQLQERFREKLGVSGSVNRKAVRFLLSALSEAKVGYSKYLMPHRGVGGNGRRARTVRSPKGAQGKPPSADAEPPKADDPPNSRRFTLPIPGKSEATLILPDPLSAGEWELVDSYMRMYISLGGK